MEGVFFLNITKYESQNNVVDTALFHSDGLAFAVLTGIVNAGCTFVFTDHERFVLCYSCAPYPVWLWTAEGITEQEKEEIWKLCREEHILPGQIRKEGEPAISGLNLKYEMADYFIRRGQEEAYPLAVFMNMLVYECRNILTPEKQAEGSLTHMTEEDIEDVAAFIWQFKQDTGLDLQGKDACREKAEKLIGWNEFFLWKNEEGKNVAMCSYGEDDGLGKVGLVFCRSEERRKGYAQTLVYQVTKIIQEQGLLPVLYTDADYEASNRCYQKIGYEQKGQLCTIGKQ